MDIYRRLCLKLISCLKRGLFIYRNRVAAGGKALQMMNNFTEVQLIKDLAGYERAVMARKGQLDGNQILES